MIRLGGLALTVQVDSIPIFFPALVLHATVLFSFAYTSRPTVIGLKLGSKRENSHAARSRLHCCLASEIATILARKVSSAEQKQTGK